MHWSQNTRERYGVNRQNIAYLYKNLGYNNLIEEQLKTLIENRGEELQKLLGRKQKFNANIIRSNTYFIKQRKELEALME